MEEKENCWKMDVYFTDIIVKLHDVNLHLIY